LSLLLKILNEDNVFKSLGIFFQYFEARTLRQLYRQVFKSPVFKYITGTGTSVMRVDFTKGYKVITILIR